jgi:periplasmic divalent cation tolerance protein
VSYQFTCASLMTAVLLYITADTPEEAGSIARTLVEERLAACTNILGSISSYYWWDGKVQEGSETALIAKTRNDLIDAVTERIKALHGYTCPCVVALPVMGGNRDFLKWISQETMGLESGSTEGSS